MTTRTENKLDAKKLSVVPKGAWRNWYFATKWADRPAGRQLSAMGWPSREVAEEVAAKAMRSKWRPDQLAHYNVQYLGAEFFPADKTDT